MILVKTKLSLNWFVWSFEDGFEYYETQTEAVHAARNKISTFYVDNYWEENVEEIKVGCMICETQQINRLDNKHKHTCNYRLKPFENF